MCASMADIESATAKIRRGKKIEERKKKPQGKNTLCLKKRHTFGLL